MVPSVAELSVDDSGTSARLVEGEIPPEVGELGRRFRIRLRGQSERPDLTQWAGLCLLFLDRLEAHLTHSWVCVVKQEVSQYAATDVNPNFFSLKEVERLLLYLLEESWNVDVAPERVRRFQSVQQFRKGFAQSGPTAVLLHELLRGEILRHEEQGGKAHFSNRFGHGKKLDLIAQTLSLSFTNKQPMIVSADWVLQTKQSRESDIKARYARLHARFILAVAGMARCCACPPSGYTVTSVKEERLLSS